MPSRFYRLRRLRRGVTLIEILVVLAIMSLVAGGVGIASYRYWKDAQRKTAITGARTLRSAVKSWWVMSGKSTCPTVAELIRDHALDEDSPRTDPWGKPWRIECSDDAVSVSSNGPDQALGTDDDIRIPPLNRSGGDAAPEDSS